MAEKITDETTVGTTEVATVLGISIRRVQQLAQDGKFPTVSRGRFLLCDTVQRYLTYSTPSANDAEDIKIEKAKRQAEATLKASKAMIAKMEAEELKGTMHRAEDVEAITSELVYTIRSALTALPGRLALDVVNAETPAEASEIIRAEVNNVMRELADFKYDPDKYAERVRDRRNWTEGGADDE